MPTLPTPPTEAVLFILNGVREVDIFLAPMDALLWSHQVKPGTHTLPEHLKKALTPFLAKHAEMDGVAHISPGTTDNDAALYLSGLCRRFKTVKQVLAHIQKQGWNLSKHQYDGLIY